MKRLEVEVPDHVHAFILELARTHHIPARDIAGAAVYGVFNNPAHVHNGLVANLSPILMANLHKHLLSGILDWAVKMAEEEQGAKPEPPQSPKDARP